MNKVNEPQKFKSRITDWPIDERPREKLMQLGPQAVTNAELIAILLGHGCPTTIQQKVLRTGGCGFWTAQPS